MNRLFLRNKLNCDVKEYLISRYMASIYGNLYISIKVLRTARKVGSVALTPYNGCLAERHPITLSTFHGLFVFRIITFNLLKDESAESPLICVYVEGSPKPGSRNEMKTYTILEDAPWPDKTIDPLLYAKAVEDSRFLSPVPDGESE